MTPPLPPTLSPLDFPYSPKITIAIYLYATIQLFIILLGNRKRFFCDIIKLIASGKLINNNNNNNTNSNNNKKSNNNNNNINTQKQTKFDLTSLGDSC